MTSTVRHVTFDADDPYALAQFWSAVTGRSVAEDDSPGDPEVLVGADGTEPALLFVRVPESKTIKNRVHLDLRPTDRPRDEEVQRVLALGATLIDDRRNPDGSGWAVLADPEGNEFCVERSAEERGAGELAQLAQP
jgi:predicted enzyme related to lactoylglutathione lyase